jgi:flagellar biosynthesis protein FliR
MNVISIAIPYLYLLHVLTISVRVGSALLFAPIWGHPGLPNYLRIMLVFSIAAGVSVIVPFNPAAYTNPTLIFPAEFLIGLLLATGIRIAFAGLQFAGQLVSYHLGFSAVQAIDPMTQNRSTLMSSYFTLVGYSLILAANQHHLIFRALSDSYQAFPIGASISMNQWFASLMAASAQIFVIGWKIALPVFVATFLLEVSIGFIARMQVQINTMVVSAPLRLLVGIVVLGASLTFIPKVVGPLMEAMVLKK